MSLNEPSLEQANLGTVIKIHWARDEEPHHKCPALVTMSSLALPSYGSLSNSLQKSQIPHCCSGIPFLDNYGWKLSQRLPTWRKLLQDSDSKREKETPYLFTSVRSGFGHSNSSRGISLRTLGHCRQPGNAATAALAKQVRCWGFQDHRKSPQKILLGY